MVTKSCWWQSCLQLNRVSKLGTIQRVGSLIKQSGHRIRAAGAFSLIALLFSGSTFAAARVTYDGAISNVSGGSQYRIIGAGDLTIQCDSWGSEIRVYRVGKSIIIEDVNPRGKPTRKYTFNDNLKLVGKIILIGSDAPDVYQNDTDLPDNVDGKGGNDSLTCGFGLTIAHGGWGDDTIYLRSTTYIVANNQAFGDDGRDYIYGSDVKDFIFGGNDGDYLQGNDGDDYLIGGGGGDIVFGDGGNDELNGSFDGIADLLSGGEGSDEYTVFAYPGSSVLLDGKYYDIEPEVIIDDGFDRRTVIRVSPADRIRSQPGAFEFDQGNLDFIDAIVVGYGEDNVLDPFMVNYAYDIEPITSASPEEIWLSPTVSIESAAQSDSRPPLIKNSVLKVKGF